MDNQPNTQSPAQQPNIPAAGAQTPQAAPGTPQALSAAPFSLPAELSPELARQRIIELQRDRDFGARWIANGNDGPEGRLMDALTRKSLGQQQPEAKVESTEEQRAIAGLGAPASPTDYTVETISGHPIRLDEANRTLIHGTLLPAAHALDLAQSDVTMIAANVMKATSFEECDAALHNLWGPDFEKGLDDFRAAVTDPKLRALLEEHPETLGNNPMLITSIVAAYRRRQGRR